MENDLSGTKPLQTKTKTDSLTLSITISGYTNGAIYQASVNWASRDGVLPHITATTEKEVSWLGNNLYYQPEVPKYCSNETIPLGTIYIQGYSSTVIFNSKLKKFRSKWFDTDLEEGSLLILTIQLQVYIVKIALVQGMNQRQV